MNPHSLPVPVAKAIEAKCGSIQSLALAWKAAAAKALAAGGSPERVALLVALYRSSRSLERLAEGLGSRERPLAAFCDELMARADESDYELADWVAAIERVQDDLLQRSRNASAFAVLGYVQCCADFGRSGPSRESLADLVEGMLKAYGFEGREGDDAGATE